MSCVGPHASWDLVYICPQVIALPENVALILVPSFSSMARLCCWIAAIVLVQISLPFFFTIVTYSFSVQLMLAFCFPILLFTSSLLFSQDRSFFGFLGPSAVVSITALSAKLPRCIQSEAPRLNTNTTTITIQYFRTLCGTSPPVVCSLPLSSSSCCAFAGRLCIFNHKCRTLILTMTTWT